MLVSRKKSYIYIYIDFFLKYIYKPIWEKHCLSVFFRTKYIRYVLNILGKIYYKPMHKHPKNNDSISEPGKDSQGERITRRFL